MLKSLFEKPQAVNSDQDQSTVALLKSLVARSKNGVVQIAPGVARRLLDELNFPDQRSVDSGRVYGHRYAIITGDWLEGHVITFVILPDGRVWLVDGQHRLTAISEGDCAVAATLRLVPVENEREAREFYAGFDKRSSVRTNAQLIAAVKPDGIDGLSTRLAGKVYAATPLLMNDLEPVRGTASIRAQPDLYLQANRMRELGEWGAEALQYQEIIKPATKGLRRCLIENAGLIAVALYTLRHQPGKAREFWSGVARNDGLKKGDPRNTLIDDLMTRNLQSGSIRQRVQQPAIAWNAWFEGRTLKIIKCIPGAAITVSGTPLQGGRR